YAPYRLAAGSWDARRNALGDAATATIAQYAPGFESLVAAREVITPLDLERCYGLTGGDIFHGELALDQWFVTRPILGFARYTTPVRNLFLCGSGTHPGTGLNGRSGAAAAREIIRCLKTRRRQRGAPSHRGAWQSDGRHGASPPGRSFVSLAPSVSWFPDCRSLPCTASPPPPPH